MRAWGGLALVAIVGCARDEPVEMPQVVPATCDDGAQCGAGRCAMVDGHAECTCAQDAARADAHVCVALHLRKACHGTRCEGVVGCTAPEHCDNGSVCERLTGRCIERAQLSARRVEQPRGRGEAGDFCFVRGTNVDGCGDLTAKDRCGEGLQCAPTGPLEHNLVCGYPANLPGVCRPTCDLDAPFCALGQGCMFVRGAGAVCLPLGFADGRCGEALCRPGETCLLGGAIGGAAVGECRVPCESGEQCPEGTGECRPEHERFDGALFCG